MSNFPTNVICATSTISDGNMAFRFGEKDEVLHNRTHFLEKHGLSYNACVPMQSDHHDYIVEVTEETKGYTAQSREESVIADVLITQLSGVTLLLTTADCQPVSFYDPTTQTIALAHISRHTLAHNLAHKTVDFLRQQFNTVPEDLLVHIGPYIHKESYAFPLPLTQTEPILAPYITEKDGLAYIDTRAACISQLISRKVKESNITISDNDTAQSDAYWSHYRSQKDNTSEGRMATILAMK